MPVKWGTDNDHRLLLTIISTHKLTIDSKKVAENWPKDCGGEKPTARAISERLFKIRKEACLNADDFNISKPRGRSPVSTPSRARDTVDGANDATPIGTRATASRANASTGKRKRNNTIKEEVDSDDEYAPSAISAAEKRALGLNKTPTAARKSPATNTFVAVNTTFGMPTPTPRSIKSEHSTTPAPTPTRAGKRSRKPSSVGLDTVDPLASGSRGGDDDDDELPGFSFGLDDTALDDMDDIFGMNAGSSTLAGSAAGGTPAHRSRGPAFDSFSIESNGRSGSAANKRARTTIANDAEGGDDDWEATGYGSESEGFRSEYKDEGEDAMA
ncbi:MAG: hypothetical protein M1821_006872 [Bathelium mastoideum]|nr:MAG: hypothetical protein M1821_006872 [Bathelium mastoideum]